MIRPRKMIKLELTVLERDVDAVIEHLGKTSVIHLEDRSDEDDETEVNAAAQLELIKTKELLQNLQDAAIRLNISLPEEAGLTTVLPSPEDAELVLNLCERIKTISDGEQAQNAERRKIAEALTEAKAFANLRAPFSELNNLSYLALRVGRLDPRKQEELALTLSDRAVLVPLGDGDRVLAAASRKGRFALDSELKKSGFTELEVPEGFKGIPAEMLEGLEKRLSESDQKIALIGEEKAVLGKEIKDALSRLTESYLMAVAVEELKASLRATASAYRLDGWVAADRVHSLVEELEHKADGRVAVRAYKPEELKNVLSGTEKVPVSLDNGAFVKGFEGLVFSYGAPLYGTIDPTPFVALSFTVLFGLMFGDLGQGFVLFLLGILISRKRLAFLKSFSHFGTPLIAVGISSMIVGMLDGEVFSNETLLIQPTRAITGFISGVPIDRVLHLMPEKGSLERLFYFFAFTVGVGVVINSIGLLINIINQFSLRRYEKAIFAKTGLAGALLFWYALFMVVRIALGSRFMLVDVFGLAIPAAALFLGPAIWRLISREKPVLEHGLLVFFMEGFVELLESASSYISNTVSFLRVGAFALSHTVLSFIVFTLSDLVRASSPMGPVFALLVLIFGNTVIIVLEGMIVAIQVVRLQYYEFFSKFFSETGVEFTPFRFRREADS